MTNPRLLLAAMAAFALGACVREVRQPMMVKARDLLSDAHRQLSEASHDKGGHRVKALEEIQLAINEVNLGIEYDATH
jgi:hypothetical protein